MSVPDGIPQWLLYLSPCCEVLQKFADTSNGADPAYTVQVLLLNFDYHVHLRLYLPPFLPLHGYIQQHVYGDQ